MLRFTMDKMVATYEEVATRLINQEEGRDEQDLLTSSDLFTNIRIASVEDGGYNEAHVYITWNEAKIEELIERDPSEFSYLEEDIIDELFEESSAWANYEEIFFYRVSTGHVRVHAGNMISTIVSDLQEVAQDSFTFDCIKDTAIKNEEGIVMVDANQVLEIIWERMNGYRMSLNTWLPKTVDRDLRYAKRRDVEYIGWVLGREED